MTPRSGIFASAVSKELKTARHGWRRPTKLRAEALFT
jgi:hypothetical protein